MKLDILSQQRCVTFALVLSGAILSSGSALAQSDEVTLKSADGTVNLSGTLVDFTDDIYLLRTELGDLRVSVDQVTCEGFACPTFETPEADVHLRGSDTVGEGVVPLLLSGYAAYLGADVTVTETGGTNQILATMVSDQGFGDPMGTYLVTSTGSGTSFPALLDGSADIGMASRRTFPAEARALRDAGAGNMIDPRQEHIIAVDNLVVITHPDNPVTQMTMQQLRDIFTGQITNWAEVGGNDAPIIIIDKPAEAGTGAVFYDRVFGANPPERMSTNTFILTNNDTAAAVAEDPNALGYVGFAFKRENNPVEIISDCGIAMVPDAFSARTGEYGIGHNLHMYTRADLENQSAEEFINFVTSNAADSLVAKAGFIDLGVDRKPQTLNSGRARQLLDPNVNAFEGGFMRQMLSEMIDHDRLSTTFRFQTGSQRLTQRGFLDLARLADYLESESAGTKVLFVGFTDSVGAFESNRTLSIRRANSVMETLQEFAGDRLTGIEMEATGFGEIAPSACNETKTGQAINRRVEVWIQSNPT